MRVACLVICLMLLGGMAHGKQGRTYYDEATMARVQEKIERYEWGKGQVANSEAGTEWYVGMSDQELWDLVPPPEQLRAINVCTGHDCPFCGDEINRKAGHYPWIMDRDKPFKVTCPVCGRTFPENDFEPWNTKGLEGEPEHGERIIDKGLGWVGPDDRRYYFVPYYIYWQRWKRDIMGGISRLAHAYLLTGKPVYGHKCAVLMAKLASEYERFDYRVQAYHEHRFNVPGRISDRIWSCGDDGNLARAYDALYPIFDADEELLAFLQKQGIEAPRELIEQKMIRVMAEDVMAGRVVGNMGMHQRTLCILAIVLDNDDAAKGPTTEAMRDWLMSGPGRVEDLLWNEFWREGLGGESSPGYASSWCRNFYTIAELLPRLGVNIWDNPKLKKMADIGIDMTCAGKFTPDIGDSGGLKGSGPIAMSAALQGPAFTHYGDPRHAKALVRMNAQSRDLFEDYFDEQEVARVVAEQGSDIEWATRNLGGYGLAILESGSEVQRRAVSMYYGYAGGGHGHHDRLTIEMWDFGRPMMPDDGYPTPFTRRDFWNWRSTDTVKHYCVVVDETTQLNKHAGDLHTLASTPELQYMDASAEVAYAGMVSLYRRCTALIDISEEAAYLLDIFRVRGGRQHDWCFHGPAFFELAVAGGQFGPVQEQGTLAGVNVPYGTKPPPRPRNGIALNLMQGEGLRKGSEYRELSKEAWAICNDSVLTRRPDTELKMQTAEIAPGKVKVLMHFYDYNEGSNLVNISLGGVTQQLLCEPSGKVGWEWVSSEVFELTEPVTEVVVSGEQVGQTYIQIDSLVVTRDLKLEAPAAMGGVTSGYHGLYNVRRMRPESDWSAVWHKADEDLSLTMTMPEGCAEEVIVADASPELQVGNPEEIQYVLGRNLLPEEKIEAGEELLSKYVAVIEAHRGSAKVEQVDYLQCASASPETVGLVIRREGASDLVHSSPDSTERCQWRGAEQPLEVAAEFALLTLDHGGLKRAIVVNGTLLQYGDFALHLEPAPEGKVLAVDFASNAITIDQPLAIPEACRDKVVILSNDLQKTSYTIEETEVRGAQTTLGFGDVLLIVGMGAVVATDDEAGAVTSDRAPGRISGGTHAGRWLYNEDKSQGFRIERLAGKQYVLQGVEGSLEEVFTDADGDGRRLFWISNVGPGDAYRIPTSTYYAR